MTPRACRVCGCTDDHACVTAGTPCHWLSAGDDLCSACAPALVHVVTIKPHAGYSVARCACGWSDRGPRNTPRAQASAIRRHLRDAVLTSRLECQVGRGADVVRLTLAARGKDGSTLLIDGAPVTPARTI